MRDAEPITSAGADPALRRRHPRELGSGEVNAFLTHLAVDLQVSASTQNQALSALLFLYRELLERRADSKCVPGSLAGAVRMG